MALVLLAVVVLLPVAAALAAYLLVDSDAVKARLADGVRQATGRELTVAGPVRIGWSLTPTLRLQDVRLLNPPGFSRADTLRVGAVEAQVALWPLLSRRVEVRRLVVEQPDVLLERDAAGRGNWEVSRLSPPPDAAPRPAEAPRQRVVVDVQSVVVRDGVFAWRGGGHPVVVRTPELRATGEGAGARLSGGVVVAGERFEVSGTMGPPAAPASGPVDVAVTGAGAAITVRGAPGRGWDLGAAIPDFSTLSGFAGRAMPAVRDVRVAVRAAGGLQSVQVDAGPGDLGAVAPGLVLERLSVAAPAPDQPVVLSATGTSRGQAVALAGRTGGLAGLLAGGPVPVEATLAAAGASVSVQGTVPDLRGRALDAVVAARVPDLQAFGAVFGVALPTGGPVALDVRASPVPEGVALRGLRVTGPQGDLAGDLVLGQGQRPFVRGSLVSQRLDLDGLAALRPAPQPGPQPGPAVAPAPAPGPVPDRVLPDTPLPFEGLRRADADLRVQVGAAVWRGTPYQVEGRVLLADGRLRLEPWNMVGPGGAVAVQATVDASGPVPAVALALRAPGLAAGPLLGVPDGAAGTLELDVALAGRGGSVRAIAATLDGHLGVAMVDGELDNRWLLDRLEAVLRGANLPFDGNGRSKVRCLAFRLESAAGQAVVRALTLDTSRLLLTGEGGMSLRDETLDLRLRPTVRLGGTGVGLAVKVGGTFRAPKPVMDAGPAQPGRVGVVIGALGGVQPAEDSCPAALLLARNGRAGPAPAPGAAAPGAKPADLLRGLFR